MSPSVQPDTARAQWAALGACLLDFEAFPGRYPLALREPRLLFDHGTEVLVLASGRPAEGLPQDEALQVQLRKAARFFVRTAMLRPGTDHYTLLGLKPAFDSATLRDHYRMLMRLTHPDFSGGGRFWPADAATRINQANDVLASPMGRQNYDRTLGGSKHTLWPPPQGACRHFGAAAGDTDVAPAFGHFVAGVAPRRDGYLAGQWCVGGGHLAVFRGVRAGPRRDEGAGSAARAGTIGDGARSSVRCCGGPGGRGAGIGSGGGRAGGAAASFVACGGRPRPDA
jgi:hypothetical protein